MTRICILYAREKKSKNFLYIEGMEMTVTDCHHEKTAVQKMEHAKNFRFWERFVFDLHRPTSTYIKKMQKARKTGKCRSMYLISILYAREKKSKNFFYIERYGNDLHRPTSFLFSSPGGKKLLPHETETSTIIVVCQSASCTSFLFYFCWFCPRSKSDRHRLSRKKCKKARKTGK